MHESMYIIYIYIYCIVHKRRVNISNLFLFFFLSIRKIDIEERKQSVINAAYEYDSWSLPDEFDRCAEQTLAVARRREHRENCELSTFVQLTLNTSLQLISNK